MYDYLEDILDEMPMDMNGTSPTPASENLFDMEDDSIPLNEKESDFFHRTTARLLFAAKRARPDLQVAVAYLCTRIKCPNRSDYRKLTRVIKYLRLTIFIPLVLGWDGTGRLTWSVDASFAVHKDMRSHTGAVLSLGQGALMPMSLKQKINTKSSTEAELVAVDDAMNFDEWIQLFVEQQTKSLEDTLIIKKFGLDTVIQQDNTSTIQLENNGQAVVIWILASYLVYIHMIVEFTRTPCALASSLSSLLAPLQPATPTDTTLTVKHTSHQ
jgi:hypothetical protein